MNMNVAYTTSMEIDFIKGLGSHSLHAKDVPRKDLLNGYLRGCQRRERWDRIDRQAVVDFAKKELAKLS